MTRHFHEFFQLFTSSEQKSARFQDFLSNHLSDLLCALISRFFFKALKNNLKMIYFLIFILCILFLRMFSKAPIKRYNDKVNEILCALISRFFFKTLKSLKTNFFSYFYTIFFSKGCFPRRQSKDTTTKLMKLQLRVTMIQKRPNLVVLKSLIQHLPGSMKSANL